MIKAALLVSSFFLIPAANPMIDDSKVLHCHPLAHILHSLADPKYEGFFEPPIRIDDESGLETIRSFYNYANEDKDDTEEPPKWTLAVMVKEKDKGGFLMVGFSVKPQDLADKDHPDEKLPEHPIEGMCRTLRLSAASWTALDNELHGHKS